MPQNVVIHVENGRGAGHFQENRAQVLKVLGCIWKIWTIWTGVMYLDLVKWRRVKGKIIVDGGSQNRALSTNSGIMNSSVFHLPYRLSNKLIRF